MWKGHNPGSSSPGPEKAGGVFPAQGLQDAPGQRENYKRTDRHAFQLASFRIPGLFCGQRIFPQDETVMETLARYIIRASSSQERMQYLAEPSMVVYRVKDGTGEKVFDALEWLAPICSHIPDKGKGMVRS